MGEQIYQLQQSDPDGQVSSEHYPGVTIVDDPDFGTQIITGDGPDLGHLPPVIQYDEQNNQ